MTLDEAVAELERGFAPEDGPAYSTGPTGEPYVIIVSGGKKTEGESAACLCFTQEKAIELWLDAAKKYVARVRSDRVGLLPLFWRVRPEIDSSEVHMPDPSQEGVPLKPRTVWLVYSRLLIPAEQAVAA